MKEFKLALPFVGGQVYRQVVAFLNFSLNLSPQEQLVLAKLIEYNIEYSSIEENKRAKFILSTEIRQEIYRDLGMKSTAFSQVLKRLKTKKFFGKEILSESGVLNKTLIIEPSEEGIELGLILTRKEEPAKAVYPTPTPIPKPTPSVPEEIIDEVLPIKEEQEIESVAKPAHSIGGFEFPKVPSSSTLGKEIADSSEAEVIKKKKIDIKFS